MTKNSARLVWGLLAAAVGVSVLAGVLARNRETAIQRRDWVEEQRHAQALVLELASKYEASANWDSVFESPAGSAKYIHSLQVEHLLQGRSIVALVWLEDITRERDQFTLCCLQQGLPGMYLRLGCTGDLVAKILARYDNAVVPPSGLETYAVVASITRVAKVGFRPEPSSRSDEEASGMSLKFDSTFVADGRCLDVECLGDISGFLLP